ncbi:MAG: homoserine dehydrogenase [Bdellovibrionales bacterium]
MTSNDSKKDLRVALAGLGTVGGATLKVLQAHAEALAARCGRRITVVAVSAKGRARVRAFNMTGIEFVDKALALAERPDIDVVCEMIGGQEGVAFDLCEASLKNGKSVVTANKAMLAMHGVALAKLAETTGAQIKFEAAVGGGIPVIKTMREALAGNNVSSVRGILNGTCNYILTRMEREFCTFEQALKDAQYFGYAEADPSADIDGHDSAHKLCILASLAFGVQPDLSSLPVEGIRRITDKDFQFAKELGYGIKMVGAARMCEGGMDQWVAPCLVPLDSPLAAASDVMNAIELDSDALGPLLLMGRGAGGSSTASAVISDLVDLARGNMVNSWGQPVATLRKALILPAQEAKGRWYIRLQLTDKPGVLADISAILRDHAISIGALLQHGRGDKSSVPVIIVTHETNEATLRAALAKIAKLEAVWEAPLSLRIDTNKD